MMTVTLTPDTETRLRAYAEKLALDPEQLSDALLTRDLEEAEAEIQATLAGLDESAEDIAAGRWITSEELDRRLEARAAAARSKRNGSHAAEATQATSAGELNSRPANR